MPGRLFSRYGTNPTRSSSSSAAGRQRPPPRRQDYARGSDPLPPGFLDGASHREVARLDSTPSHGSSNHTTFQQRVQRRRQGDPRYQIPSPSVAVMDEMARNNGWARYDPVRGEYLTHEQAREIDSGEVPLGRCIRTNKKNKGIVVFKRCQLPQSKEEAQQMFPEAYRIQLELKEMGVSGGWNPVINWIQATSEEARAITFNLFGNIQRHQDKLRQLKNLPYVQGVFLKSEGRPAWEALWRDF